MSIFAEEGNRRTRRKTLEARERINNKLNSHMTPSPGIEPEITVVRGERLAAAPPMLLNIYVITITTCKLLLKLLLSALLLLFVLS
jgi:hypothetical protein